MYEYGTDYHYLDVQENGTECVMESENVVTVDLNGAMNVDTVYSYECPRNEHKEVERALYSPLNDAHYFGNIVFDMYKKLVRYSTTLFQTHDACPPALRLACCLLGRQAMSTLVMVKASSTHL